MGSVGGAVDACLGLVSASLAIGVASLAEVINLLVGGGADATFGG